MKHSSHLRLVEKLDSRAVGKSRGRFRIAEPTSLSEPEQKRLNSLIEEIVAGESIIAVQQGVRSWDLRPIVNISEESCPTMIRFFGHEMTLARQLSSEAEELLDVVAGIEPLARSAQILEWGVVGGQLWYRRLVVNSTLEEEILRGENITFAEAKRIALSLIRSVEALHRAKVVHGHICSSNVARGENNEIFLLDPGIGYFCLTAARQLGSAAISADEGFAPEIISGAHAEESADIYGVGRVLSDLFANVQDEPDPQAMKPIREVLRAVADPNPLRRPSLASIVDACSDGKRSFKTSSALKDAVTPEPVVVPEQKSVRSKIKDEPEAGSEQRGRVKELNFDDRVNEQEPVWQKEQAATPSAVQAKQRLSSKAILIPVLVVAAICAAIMWSRSGSNFSEITAQDLQNLWSSKRPSMAATVAEVALSDAALHNYAENLIINSVLEGQEVPKGVEKSIIRIAFDERWEQTLQSSDRRFALTLALSGLLGNKTPRDVPALDRVHPAIVLALTVAAGNNVQPILAKIPAEVLIALPPPLGPAFQELARSNPQLTCGDREVQTLAKLTAYGIGDADPLVQYISENTETRLRSIAQVFSQDPAQARRVLTVILSHPNLSVNDPFIAWARTWQISDWKELKVNDQLFLLAGIPPADPLKAENIGKLFSHPSVQLRSLAIVKSLESIAFEHPGAYEVLKFVQQDAKILNAKQLVDLARLLETPSKANSELIDAWLATKPAQQILEILLISTSGNKQATTLDFEISRTLQKQNWEPKLTELQKLSGHPDRLTRFFAYTKLYKLEDRETAKVILSEALKHETDTEFRKQISSMVKELARK
ncbi:hypothetical protein JNK13_02955 [bacterium]|nr:hypothetical protein [bacterium]